jgi:hypothetical protein
MDKFMNECAVLRFRTIKIVTNLVYYLLTHPKDKHPLQFVTYWC